MCCTAFPCALYISWGVYMRTVWGEKQSLKVDTWVICQGCKASSVITKLCAVFVFTENVLLWPEGPHGRLGVGAPGGQDGHSVPRVLCSHAFSYQVPGSTGEKLPYSYSSSLDLSQSSNLLFPHNCRSWKYNWCYFYCWSHPALSAIVSYCAGTKLFKSASKIITD